MTVFFCLGGISLVLILIASWVLRRTLSKKEGSLEIESYISLLAQSFRPFNQRILWVLMQFVLVSNVMILVASYFFDVSISNVIVFDMAILIYALVIYLMISFFPNSIAAILNEEAKGFQNILKKILIVGSFQSLSFFGVFLFSIFATITFFGINQLLALASGILVVSFYYRSAGGAYKASSKGRLSVSTTASLTHPARILGATGDVIASIGGYFLDIFSSLTISIASFFIYLLLHENQITVYEFLEVPEVIWVFNVLIFTAISLLVSIILGRFRANKNNVFLEMGYLAIGFTALLTILSSENMMLGICIALISMLGIAFFTNYLTSEKHQPIKFICKQAQYGSSQLLIAAFFNGLIGNGIFILFLLLTLVIIFKSYGLVSLLMVIIYMLSIAVIACTIKAFSVIASQVKLVIDSDSHPTKAAISKRLRSVSYTLVAIGNSFSSASGIISSISVIVPVMTVLIHQTNVVTIDHVFGLGLGVIVISIFYALGISGAYRALMDSMAEVYRQFNEIPQLAEKGKSHPNMFALADKHAVNVLRAVTYPGIWILVSLSFIYLIVSMDAIYGALIGIFASVFIHSFFWSIFGDCVSSAYNHISAGFYGGKKASPFQGVEEAHHYAHYFQWVLGPTGVIIMKFVGVVTIMILVI